jgi:uncharacterized protein DUF732
MLTATTAMIAAGVALAAPAPADTTNDAFLNALNGAGIGYNDPNATAALGERVCPMLVEPGKSLASVYSTVANNGISPGMASFFTGIAISMYCPQMMGSIGNGTFLNQLQGLQGLPGVPGVPGMQGLPAVPGVPGF